MQVDVNKENMEISKDNKTKADLKEKSERIIKDFLTEMATQDNRATAFPYFYVIRDKAKVPAYDGCGEDTEYRWNDETYDSMEELEAYWTENDFTAAEIEEARNDVEEYEYKYEWIQKHMFLTEKDAEDHLRRNHYHYSKDAHTYVDHAWRAPYLEDFLKALFVYFNMPKGNLDFRLENQ